MFSKKQKEIVEILKNDGVGVIPTDTIYGLVGSAFSKKVVERIFYIKKRNSKKPFIILISSFSDLEKFEIKINEAQYQLLNKIWPGKISVILPCLLNQFRYLHLGTKSLAFRLPAKKSLIEILKRTGPLVAPSANPEKLKPAENITQAKKYFGNQVDFYLSTGTIKSKSSVLIKINKNSEIETFRGIIKSNLTR